MNYPTSGERRAERLAEKFTPKRTSWKTKKQYGVITLSLNTNRYHFGPLFESDSLDEASRVSDKKYAAISQSDIFIPIVWDKKTNKLVYNPTKKDNNG